MMTPVRAKTAVPNGLRKDGERLLMARSFERLGNIINGSYKKLYASTPARYRGPRSPGGKKTNAASAFTVGKEVRIDIGKMAHDILPCAKTNYNRKMHFQ
jgi:hypothetical protein